MPTLSIIIPASGSESRWERTLVSVLQNRPEDTEILVVVPGRYNDPYQLREEVRFVEVGRRASLVAYLRAS